MTRSFEEVGQSIGRLVDEKNRAYGDSFRMSGDVLRILYPDGIRPEQYDDALAITRITDKLFRIASQKDAFGESPYQDIAGYGILGTVAAIERRQQQNEAGTNHRGAVCAGENQGGAGRWSEAHVD